jgi:quinol-cytochrome oxidoreductase complex cytochrome b subunit
MRIVAGLIVGIIVFLGILMTVEWAAHQVSPRPASTGLYAIVVVAYFGSALAGALAAGLIAGRSGAAWAIAILFTAGVLWTLAEVPHPLWMQIASVLAPLLAGFVASAIVRRRVTAG